MKTPRCILVWTALCCLSALPTLAQVTAFTYQGRLNDGPNPANGVFDVRFGLWNSPDTGNSTQLGLVTNLLTRVTNGLFTVRVDFGGPVWTGGDRWLELAVRTNGPVPAGFTTLGPRQPVSPTPYAIYADSVPATGLKGFLPGNRIASGTIESSQISNSVGLWNRSANNIFYTNGNVGIGINNPAAKLHVAGPVTASGFIGDGSGLTGLSASQISNGSVPTAALGNAWQVGGNAGTSPGANFLGTTDNQPLEIKVNNQRGLRLEYQRSPLTQSMNVIGGYGGNLVSPGTLGATISGGGGLNIGGDGPNRVTADFGTVGGGYLNSSGGGFAATVGGGNRNTASGDYATVPGGASNIATNYALAAGNRARAVHPGAFVWADSQNADFSSTSPNQFNVRAVGGARFETGGTGLTVDGSPVVTSAANVALRNGGNNFTGNQIITDGSGFFGNHSGGLSGVGPGVRIFRDTFTGTGSIFAYDYVSNAALPLVFQQAGGNVGIGTSTPATKLHVAGEITATVVTITSDRNAKEQFKPVNAREVLDKVARLPISEWQYKTVGDARHIGPMAQDFREAFALGRDDKHITSVDADGVALAAIQGLNEKLEEKSREVETLKKSLASLTELVNKLAAQQNGGAK